MQERNNNLFKLAYGLNRAGLNKEEALSLFKKLLFIRTRKIRVRYHN